MNYRVIEVKKLQGESKVVQAEADQMVYIADIINTQVYIKGKCMKVVVIDVSKSFVRVEKVSTTLEVARTKNSLLVIESSPMTVLEQCIECRIGVVSSITEFRIRRSASLALVKLTDAEVKEKTLDEIDKICQEKKEKQLPEEIQVLLEKDKIKSSIVESI